MEEEYEPKNSMLRISGFLSVYLPEKDIYISPELKRHIGSESWKLLLKEFVGVFTNH